MLELWWTGIELDTSKRLSLAPDTLVSGQNTQNESLRLSLDPLTLRFKSALKHVKGLNFECHLDVDLFSRIAWRKAVM
jgi:hypothetical protein